MRRVATLIGAGLFILVPALAQGQVLRIASTNHNLEAANPLSFANSVGYGVAEMLTRATPDGGYEPWLLETIENIDDLTWVMTLRPGITFQNGRPLDAEALVDTITHRLETAPNVRSVIPASARFEATGPLEVTFTADVPFPSLPNQLAQATNILVYDAQAVREAGDDTNALVGAGIYTGPYAIVGNDGLLTLEAYEDYWQGEPALDGVTVQGPVGADSAMLAVQNGELDMVVFMPLETRHVVATMPGVHFISPAESPLFRAYLVSLNIAEAPFDDPRVGLALLKGINYDEIANVVFGGQYRVAEGLFPPEYSWALNNQRTDVDAANALLDEAGWVRGADGFRSRDGEPLEFIVVYAGGLQDLNLASLAMLDQLRALGWHVVPTPVESTMGTLAHEWDAQIISAVATQPAELFLQRYLGPDGDRNWEGAYDNAEMHALIDELFVTFDPERRHEILERAQQILIEEDPATFNLAYVTVPMVVSDAYRDLAPGYDYKFIDWQTAPQE